VKHVVKILLIEPVTPNVKRFVVEKPKNYHFIPGQATDLSINKQGFQNKNRPFTFTSLNEDLTLEFIIKSYPVAQYPDHNGVTEKLHTLTPGDELIITDPWGTISYKESGVFIAGGAGITPFLAIFKQLYKEKKLNDNILIFSNKTQKDIIWENELRTMFKPQNLFLTLTEENNSRYDQGRVTIDFLKQRITNFYQYFYLCGPKLMVNNLRDQLKKEGAKSELLVFEQ
jgi:hypothetical protein